MWDSEEGEYIGGKGEEAGESVFDILYWTEMIFSELHDSESAAELLEHLIMDELLNIVDCIFYVTPYHEEDTRNETEELEQQTLSLF